MIEIIGIPFPRLEIDSNDDFHNIWKKLYSLNDELQREEVTRISIDWSNDKVIIYLKSNRELIIDVEIFKLTYNNETF